MQYRIRYATDGGLVERDDSRGYPHSAGPYPCLVQALRGVITALLDARVGVTLGIGLQYKVPGGAWHWISPKAMDRDAANLGIEGWSSLEARRVERRA